MDAPIELEWQKEELVTLIEDCDNKYQNDLNKKGGIYLWEERLDNGISRPAYLGKAEQKTGLWNRQIEWYFKQINGQSRLPKKYLNGTGWEFDKSKPKCRNTITKKSDYLKLVEDAFQFIQTITVYWAVPQSKSSIPFSNSDLTSVERTLLRWLDKHNRDKWSDQNGDHCPWQNTQFFDPKVELKIEHRGIQDLDENIPAVFRSHKVTLCPQTKTP